MLTIINPYYDNPKMLLRQVRQWNSYSPEILKHLEVIVVDDCSPNHPAKEALKRIGLNDVFSLYEYDRIKFDFRLYRVKKNIRWNWLMCRNLAAREAKAGNWLLLTDIDHVVPDDTIEELYSMILCGKAKKKKAYVFARVDAPNLTPYKRHPNSYFLHKDLYWKIGGYDEYYSGNYGTDGMYRRRTENIAGHVVELDCPLIRYPREVISDASTTEFRRKEGRDPTKLKKMRSKKKAEGKENDILTITFPWERLL